MRLVTLLTADLDLLVVTATAKIVCLEEALALVSTKTGCAARHCGKAGQGPGDTEPGQRRRRARGDGGRGTTCNKCCCLRGGQNSGRAGADDRANPSIGEGTTQALCLKSAPGAGEGWMRLARRWASPSGAAYLSGASISGARGRLHRSSTRAAPCHSVLRNSSARRRTAKQRDGGLCGCALACAVAVRAEINTRDRHELGLDRPASHPASQAGSLGAKAWGRAQATVPTCLASRHYVM